MVQRVQRALTRAWPTVRWLLIGLGVGFLLAVVFHMVEFLVTRSDDSKEKLYLSVLDKLCLGLAVAGVGYWLQQRLEVFKRDQSLVSELAKARIAAYHRVISALTIVEYHGQRMISTTLLFRAATPQEDEEGEGGLESLKTRTNEALEELKKDAREFTRLLEAERHLIGAQFHQAVVLIVVELKIAVDLVVGDTPPDDAEFRRLEEKRERMWTALIRSLPPFARVREDDLHFSAPDASAAVEKMGLDPLTPKTTGEAP